MLVLDYPIGVGWSEVTREDSTPDSAEGAAEEFDDVLQVGSCTTMKKIELTRAGVSTGVPQIHRVSRKSSHGDEVELNDTVNLWY